MDLRGGLRTARSGPIPTISTSCASPRQLRGAAGRGGAGEVADLFIRQGKIALISPSPRTFAAGASRRSRIWRTSSISTEPIASQPLYNLREPHRRDRRNCRQPRFMPARRGIRTARWPRRADRQYDPDSRRRRICGPAAMTAASWRRMAAESRRRSEHRTLLEHIAAPAPVDFALGWVLNNKARHGRHRRPAHRGGRGRLCPGAGLCVYLPRTKHPSSRAWSRRGTPRRPATSVPAIRSKAACRMPANRRCSSAAPSTRRRSSERRLDRHLSPISPYHGDAHEPRGQISSAPLETLFDDPTGAAGQPFIAPPASASRGCSPAFPALKRAGSSIERRLSAQSPRQPVADLIGVEEAGPRRCRSSPTTPWPIAEARPRGDNALHQRQRYRAHSTGWRRALGRPRPAPPQARWRVCSRPLARVESGSPACRFGAPMEQRQSPGRDGARGKRASCEAAAQSWSQQQIGRSASARRPAPCWASRPGVRAGRGLRRPRPRPAPRRWRRSARRGSMAAR